MEDVIGIPSLGERSLTLRGYTFIVEDGQLEIHDDEYSHYFNTKEAVELAKHLMKYLGLKISVRVEFPSEDE
jgi:hypothetical protein